MKELPKISNELKQETNNKMEMNQVPIIKSSELYDITFTNKGTQGCYINKSMIYDYQSRRKSYQSLRQTDSV